MDLGTWNILSFVYITSMNRGTHYPDEPEFLKPLGISQAELARQIGVSAGLISRIVKCKSPVTADVALRLGRFFSVSPQFWLNMQSRYDLERAKELLGSRLEEEVRVFTK